MSLSWKKNFNEGETYLIKDVAFVLVKVGKRGLALRKKTWTTEIPPKPAVRPDKVLAEL